MWGHPDTTKTLLEAGATLEPITRVEGTRPLHIAARYGSPLIVQELLSHGADKDARTYRGFTPLHAAAASNKAGVTSLLVKVSRGDIPHIKTVSIVSVRLMGAEGG